MNDQITYRHGLYLPTGGLIFASFTFIFAFVILTNDKIPGKEFISLGLIIIGIACFATTGVHIDLKNKTVIEYVSIFGFRTGTKLPLADFHVVTIIKQNYSTSSVSRAGSEVNSSFSKYNLLLANKTFFKKIVIKSCDSYNQALDEGKSLSKYLQIDLVDYKPIRQTPRRRHNGA